MSFILTQYTSDRVHISQIELAKAGQFKNMLVKLNSENNTSKKYLKILNFARIMQTFSITLTFSITFVKNTHK